CQIERYSAEAALAYQKRGVKLNRLEDGNFILALSISWTPEMRYMARTGPARRRDNPRPKMREFPHPTMDTVETDTIQRRRIMKKAFSRSLMLAGALAVLGA